MVGLLFQVVRLLRSLGRVLAEPRGRALCTLVVVQLASGTIFYHFAEGWSWLDSLYFSITTLLTVGFGDLVPTTTVSKIFTMAFLLTGAGLLVSFVALVADHLGRRPAPPEPGGPPS